MLMKLDELGRDWATEAVIFPVFSQENSIFSKKGYFWPIWVVKSGSILQIGISRMALEPLALD